MNSKKGLQGCSLFYLWHGICEFKDVSFGRIWILFFGLLWLSSASAQGVLQATGGLTTEGNDTIHCPDIVKGDTVEAVYYFKNTATVPFVIWQVHPGCQCTAPQYPKDSIAPGRSDSVTLMFYSRKTEEAHFEKYAIVLTAVGEKTFYLTGRMQIPGKEDAAVPINRKIRITNRYRTH